jgi:D-alanyl-D-alanine carboxypeptidase
MKLLASSWIILASIAVSCRSTPSTDHASDAASMKPAARPVSTDGELVSDVDSMADRFTRDDQFSGVVLISRRSQPILRKAYGLADRDAKRSNAPEILFALGSVSKMFTAVLVARLIEQSRINADAPIGSLVHDFPDGQAKSQVTVHHLLTMSSGIPDVWQLPQFWTTLPGARTLSDFWPVFGTAPLEFTPGTQWKYSNSNYLVLGAIAEQAYGEPFTAVAERYVFQPAGMTHTSYRATARDLPARGYTHMRPGSPPDSQPDHDRWYPAWEGNGAGPGGVHVPMGGGYSTADDLARFADALMQARLLTRETTERVMTGYVPAQYGGRHGYGLETRVLNGVRIMGHQGGAPGVRNQVDFYPDLGYVVVVLGNSDADGTQEIANSVRSVIAASPLLSKQQ